MRADDDARPAAGSAADAGLTRARARHAAPRKSLLTKIHIPAGKAMALAAMPTAVFVGMGLTPKLAMADDSKAAPSTSGSCVTRPDEPSVSDSPSPSASPSDSPSASATPSSSGGKSSKSGKDSGKSGSGKASDGGSSGPQPTATSSASPTPSPTTSSPSSQSGSGSGSGGGGLLGGLGSALGGLLGVHGDSSSPSPSSTPSHDATPKPSASHSATSSTDSKDDGSSKDTSGKAGDGLGKTVKGTLGGLSKAARKAGQSASPSASPSGSSDSGKKDGKGDGSSTSATQSKEQAIRDLLTQKGVKFSDATAGTQSADTKAGSGSCDDGPCDLLPTLKPPTQDTNAPTMAADPWHLTSSNLGLNGLCYRGLVDIKTASGATKRVMKFTADSIDIKDLHQTVDNRDSHGNIVTHTQIKTKPGSTSTIDGPVTMYTEKLSGNLLGLLPITFSPDFPPPIQIPSVFFTNAKVDQAGQFGGTLKMQGLHNFIGST